MKCVKRTLSYPFNHLSIHVAIIVGSASEQPSMLCFGIMKGTKTQDLRTL